MLFRSLPEPLVPRPLRRGVIERVDRDGNIITALDQQSLEREVACLLEADVESVAIAFMHAYRNPQHERQAASYIGEVAPGLSVSCSCDVSPEIREFERTSTTVINAYLQPIMERYLQRLAAGKTSGCRCCCV